MNGRLDKLAPGLVAKLNFACDEIFVFCALFLMSHGLTNAQLGLVAVLCTLALGTWFVAAGVLRLYSPCTPRSLFDAAILDVVAVLGATAVVTVSQNWLWPLGDVAVDPVRFALLLGGSSVTVRLVFARLFQRYEPPLSEVIIVGTGEEALATYERKTQGKGERCRVKGFIRLRGQPESMTEALPPVLGGSSDFERVIATTPVHEVYLAAAVTEHPEELQAIVQTCEELGLPFALPMRSLRMTRASLLGASPEHDGYLHYLATRYAPGPYAMKRIIDLFASLLALVLLSPLLGAVALAIKLTSKGPILFKQERVGLHGSTFNLFKFRSMVQNAEALRITLQEKNEQTGPVFKIKNDPRITRVGRFIRRYSVDELPQLINILRGDMTLVGPRPALPSEVATYKLWQRRRLSVRPGLTCYWQVGGRNNIGFDEWMRLDLRYVDNWSLTVDLRLILQTVPVVIAGRGAS